MSVSLADEASQPTTTVSDSSLPNQDGPETLKATTPEHTLDSTLIEKTSDMMMQEAH